MLDELVERLRENRNALFIVGLGAIAGLNFFSTGGLQKMQAQLDQEAALNAAIDRQRQAEKVFAEQGCSAQVVDAQTRTANLRDGSIVIDPMSITVDNPDGTPVNSGHVCSMDGSVFRIEEGRAVLIGTSPEVRKEMVRRGLPIHVRAMERRAIQIYKERSF